MFGAGRVERVYERALSLEAKLRDNDDAIAMKAWPGILFEFVDEDNPWTRPEMEEFMADFDGPRYGPGMMKAVSGNVNIKEFAGETANINDAVTTDVNFIISGMPGPKYTLGTFTGDLSNSEANVQERQFKKTVLDVRTQLEDVLTPYFRDVADYYDLDAADSLELKLAHREKTLIRLRCLGISFDIRLMFPMKSQIHRHKHNHQKHSPMVSLSQHQCRT